MWVSIMRPCGDNFNSVTSPRDHLYEDGSKVLIDICVDKLHDHIIVLTKFVQDTNNLVAEFRVEVYTFCEDRNEMSLVQIFNVSQILASHLNSREAAFEFSRVYHDHVDNSYVLLDSSNHKLYWCNPTNFQVASLLIISRVFLKLTDINSSNFNCFRRQSVVWSQQMVNQSDILQV